MPFLDTWCSPFEVVLERAVAHRRRRASTQAVRDASQSDASGLGASGLGASGVDVAGLEAAGREVEGAGLLSPSLEAEADRVLARIERLEVAKARVEGGLVDAYAALHTIQSSSWRGW